MKGLRYLAGLLVMFFVSTANAQYQQHDGSGELQIGVPGGIINWGTMYSVDPSATLLESIDVGFGNFQPGTLVGSTVSWQVFGDDDGDPKAGLAPLTSVNTHTVVNEEFKLHGIFDNISVGSVDLSGHPFFFIGFSYDDRLFASGFPAGQDTGSDNGTSWGAIPLVVDPADYSTGAPIANFGFPGHWIITGNVNADSDGDGVVNVLDYCPATAIPELSVPSRSLRHGRYVMQDPGSTEFTSTGHQTYTLDQTAGCSCEQILADLGTTNPSEERYGCRVTTMRNWIDEFEGDDSGDSDEDEDEDESGE